MAGLRVLVVGLGRFGGGVGVTRWLAEQGAAVTVTDLASPDSLRASLDTIADLPVNLQLGSHDAVDLDATDLVVLNPAVDKRRSDLFAEITRRNLPWTTEANLFVARCPARIVAVTGSFGKSTTCAMLAEAITACRQAGEGSIGQVYLGGNIGRSLLPDLASMSEADIVVLEVSNAQLEDWPDSARPAEVAVITNIWPHHMDRYGAFAEYVNVKLRLASDPSSQVVFGNMHEEAWTITTSHIARQPDRWHAIEPAAPPLNLRVPGAHNRTNADCALTVCRQLRLDETAARTALAAFAGLAHRMERVDEIGGVLYLNDSKSTSPDATIVAVRSVDRPTVAMVGGKRKTADLSACATVLRTQCRAVVCFGEAGPDFAQALGENEAGPPFMVRVEPTLAHGVAAARSLARPGDVVLFSPGAPSFDEHVNYVARGEQFAQLLQDQPRTDP